MLILIGIFLCAGSAFLLSGWFRRVIKSSSMQNYFGNCKGFLVPLGIALIDFPVQIIFAGLSGSSGYHSFIPVLPSLVIFMGFISWAIFSSSLEVAARHNARLWFGLLVIILILPGLFTWVDQMQQSRAAKVTQINRVVDYIKANTLPADSVVQWGMEGRVLFLANRQTSSRFIDQKPLFAKGSEKSILLFRADLSADPPVLFVDTDQANLPLILPGSGEDCGQLESDAYIEQQWRLWRDRHYPADSSLPLTEIPQGMKQVYLWICQNYTLADRVGPDGWLVYQRRNYSFWENGIE